MQNVKHIPWHHCNAVKNTKKVKWRSADKGLTVHQFAESDLLTDEANLTLQLTCNAWLQVLTIAMAAMPSQEVGDCCPATGENLI